MYRHNNTTPGVQQWTPTVARVDGGISLDPPPNKHSRPALDAPSQPRHHPRGQRVVKAKGIADGERLLAHSEHVRVSQRNWTQQRGGGVDADDGQVL